MEDSIIKHYLHAANKERNCLRKDFMIQWETGEKEESIRVMLLTFGNSSLRSELN